MNGLLDSIPLMFICTPFIILAAVLCITDIIGPLSFLVLLTVIFSVLSYDAHAVTFYYKGGLAISNLKYEDAAKLCYKTLSNGKYPGEEKGLDIIDICTNPRLINHWKSK